MSNAEYQAADYKKIDLRLVLGGKVFYNVIPTNIHNNDDPPWRNWR
jgi:hypothetical protein